MTRMQRKDLVVGQCYRSSFGPTLVTAGAGWPSDLPVGWCYSSRAGDIGEVELLEHYSVAPEVKPLQPLTYLVKDDVHAVVRYKDVPANALSRYCSHNVKMLLAWAMNQDSVPWVDLPRRRPYVQAYGECFCVVRLEDPFVRGRQLVQDGVQSYKEAFTKPFEAFTKLFGEPLVVKRNTSSRQVQQLACQLALSGGARLTIGTETVVALVMAVTAHRDVLTMAVRVLGCAGLSTPCTVELAACHVEVIKPREHPSLYFAMEAERAARERNASPHWDPYAGYY